MPIIVHLSEIMSNKGVSLNDLADKVGITNVNLSRIKTGKIRAIRFSTLYKICKELGCQPGDLLTAESDTFSDNPQATMNRVPIERNTAINSAERAERIR